MEDTAYRAIAIVGAGAVLPDAPNVPAFWKNITSGRYSISEVTPDRWDSGRSTTTPTTARRTRPTPRSAAGCASTRGIR